MHQSNHYMKENDNDLTEILAQVLNEMKEELGDKFNLDTINLAEVGRRSGISRARLRLIKQNGFVIKPHGLKGRHPKVTLLTGFTGVIDAFLMKGVTNSSVIYDRLKELGFQGGLTIVKGYISSHKKPGSGQASDRGTAGKPRQEVPDRTWRILSDGLGLHQGGNGAGSGIQARLLCHDLPLLRAPLC